MNSQPVSINERKISERKAKFAKLLSQLHDFGMDELRESEGNGDEQIEFFTVTKLLDSIYEKVN